MAKQKVVRRAPSPSEEIPERPRRGLVVRIGITIVGLAVVISSLVPLLSLFDRTPPAEATQFAEFEQAALLHPRDAAYQVQLGNAYYDARKYAQAAQAYEKALALKSDPDVRVDYGTSLFYSGKAAAALEQYRAVVKSDPKHFQARMNMGVVYRAEGKIEQAIASWKEAEPLAPDAETRKRVSELITAAAVATIGK